MPWDCVPFGDSSTGHGAGHISWTSQSCHKVLNTLQQEDEPWWESPRAGTAGGEHSAGKKSTIVIKQMSSGTAGHKKYLCLTVLSSAQKAGEQRYDLSYEGSCRTDFLQICGVLPVTRKDATGPTLPATGVGMSHLSGSEITM